MSNRCSFPGITHDRGEVALRLLIAQNAHDVAVLVDSQRRPHRLGSERDFPNGALKPADATDPPFIGPFPPSQHLIGPWQPIRRWEKDHEQTLRRDSAAPGR
jgi:thiosulfate dehydrogenase